MSRLLCDVSLAGDPGLHCTLGEPFSSLSHLNA